ncbi:hypothetical protein C9374_003035 [Naegleria lovaniensis]|uniref:Uncharacterized protein n=1 Tax=Naegleria lovaniensis TaxID=51637 RepID=A0AA88KM01_NAELO|nr:uncharacterized protein C9374_003035 [Naegleria lovaniensis]KAG2385886.1 hypothetical protein C9374_003035 [Naegleria lovaniensis]
MVQRKGGRFGIETNQTLKYNSTIQRLTHGGGEVYEWRESYFSADAIGISVPYSLDRHKCWELLASSSQIQQTPSFSSKSIAQKARLESKRQEKIEQFETKCQNKHKHIRRQYEKEQRKLKIEQEQTEDRKRQKPNPTILYLKEAFI